MRNGINPVDPYLTDAPYLSSMTSFIDVNRTIVSGDFKVGDCPRGLCTPQIY